MTDPTPTAADVAALVAEAGHYNAPSVFGDPGSQVRTTAALVVRLAAALEQVQAARERAEENQEHATIDRDRWKERAEAAETKNGWRFADEWRERARAAEAERDRLRECLRTAGDPGGCL